MPFDFLSKTLDEAKSTSVFPDFAPTKDFLVELYGSFRNYSTYDLSDKSVNGQNCRKSALLSMMLLRHKLVLRCADLTDTQKNHLFAPLIDEYCGLFRQVASLTFDLMPYLFYIKDTSAILAPFTDAHETDPLRRLRISLNHHRLALLLGQSPSVQTLQDEYFGSIGLDGKPEKGERKAADDLVLMINEVLQGEQLTSNAMYRIALLEFALELSPYNFDIQLALTQIYDQHGFSVSF
jgi:N-acetyltransferase B complex (NatB) non catalytic subunit